MRSRRGQCQLYDFPIVYTHRSLPAGIEIFKHYAIAGERYYVSYEYACERCKYKNHPAPIERALSQKQIFTEIAEIILTFYEGNRCFVCTRNPHSCWAWVEGAGYFPNHTRVLVDRFISWNRGFYAWVKMLPQEVKTQVYVENPAQFDVCVHRGGWCCDSSEGWCDIRDLHGFVSSVGYNEKELHDLRIPWFFFAGGPPVSIVEVMGRQAAQNFLNAMAMKWLENADLSFLPSPAASEVSEESSDYAASDPASHDTYPEHLIDPNMTDPEHVAD